MTNPDAYFFDKLITDLKDESSQTYQIIKNTLKSQGHWKNKPRGKADVTHFTGANTIKNIVTKEIRQTFPLDDSHFSE